MKVGLFGFLVCLITGVSGCASKPAPPVRTGEIHPELLQPPNPYALGYNGIAFVAPVQGYTIVDGAEGAGLPATVPRTGEGKGIVPHFK